MSLRAQCPLLCQAYHENLLDHPLAPSVLLVPLLHRLIPIPEQVPSQHHLQARLDMPRRKSCKTKRSLGSIRRMMKKIMRMYLGNRTRLVSWLAATYLFWRHVKLIQLCSATEHPMQTLQLNTRLSSKSWVNQVLHYLLKHLPIFFYLLAWWRWRRGSICGGTSFKQIVVSLLIFSHTSLDRWRIFRRRSRGKSPAWQIR